MRYYSIVISDPTSGKVVTPPSLTGAFSDASYTSYANGQTLSNALNIELDLPVYPFAVPAGNGFVRVWGISLQEIGQASDLHGKAIQVYGGMQSGLPLANPKQNGLLAQGYIFQAFGNWIGTDMTLDLIIRPTPTVTAPPNLVFNWVKGTSLSDAIKSTISTAFPGYTTNINISADLVLQNDETGYYSNLAQFSQYVKQISQSIVNSPTYNGVDILIKEKTFNVFDGTSQAPPKQLQFQDLIGQPTWIAPTQMQAKFVMRADLNVGDFIKFPITPVVSSAQSVSPLVNQKLTFQGTFFVNEIHHYGNFRQADAASWVTVVTASAVQPASAT